MATNNSNPVQIPNIRDFLRQHKNRIAHEIGNEAVRHFKDNFRQEGFVDNGIHKWKEVKRRDPSSRWYGFEYKGERRADYPVKYGKKGKRLKSTKRLNYSPAATQRKILTGSSGELQDSLRYKVNPASGANVSVSITSDKPYAVVQNEGGPIKVFGKASTILPARPFVGHSKELDVKIEEIVQEHWESFIQSSNK